MSTIDVALGLGVENVERGSCEVAGARSSRGEVRRAYAGAVRVSVPRLNDTRSDYEAMFRLWSEVQGIRPARVTLDFSRCNFIRHHGVAFLGGLIRFLQSNGSQVEIDWGTIHGAILRNLQQNGFQLAFGGGVQPWRGNSIPFREDMTQARDPIMGYLREHWLGARGVRVSERLGNAIRGVVWEIYANAFEHAKSHIGVFTCGQLYPKRAQLCLSVADFGTGIPSRVAAAYPRFALRPVEALRWAFRVGNTTASSVARSRGMGLNLLEEFVEKNDGQLIVYSGGARAVFSKHAAQFDEAGAAFRGTIIDIRLKCDDSYYALLSERAPTPGPLF